MPIRDLVLGRAPVHALTPEARKPLPEGVTQADLVNFLEQSRRSTRRKFGRRMIVTYIAENRVGITAEVANALSGLELNIEGASEAAVGDLFAMAFVASARDATRAEVVKDVIDRVGRPGDHRVSVIAADPALSRVPPPDFQLFHVRVRTLDRPGNLLEVVAPIAERRGFLVRFSTAVTAEAEQGTSAVGTSTDMHVGDVHVSFALPPLVDDREVVDEIRDALGGSFIDVSHQQVRSPLAYRRDVTRPVVLVGDALFVSVVGNAQSGLIMRVCEALAEARINIVGSSMAILESRTVAIFALDGQHVDEDAVHDLLSAARDEFNLSVEVFSSPTVSGHASPEADYEFLLQASDERGVLAKVAGIFAENDVSIEALHATVVGEPPIFDIWMTLALDDADVDDLRSTLESTVKIWRQGRFILKRIEPS